MPRAKPSCPPFRLGPHPDARLIHEESAKSGVVRDGPQSLRGVAEIHLQLFDVPMTSVGADGRGVGMLIIQRRMEREALSPIGNPVIPMNRPLIHMDIVKETGREQTLQNEKYQQ